ncbi:P-loop containing nucleoside triphosphate hydrolases superfamily protein [Euphorbia peplus]|nr:P-loop containing nucleoside triphosphate hydrolases superfamily protein [Euphorbia peplus]
MQKLFPKPHLSTSVSSHFNIPIPMSFRSKPNCSATFRLFSVKHHSFSSLSMPPAALLPAAPGYSSLSTKPNIQFYTTHCRSSAQVKTVRQPFRAWLVARPAWFCTVAGKDGSVTAAAAVIAVDGLKGEEDGDGDKGGEKTVRLNRRQRGSSEVLSNADLLTIPGVGPKNLRKLVQKGFRGMAELKQLYKDKFRGKSNEKMVEYLQSSVGIIHKNHAESITDFIKDTVDEELKDVRTDLKSSQKNRITFCVEGNISVGKTTFLQRIVRDTIELQDLVEVVPEPIDKWQDIGPDHFNILDAFYAEPHRYAYTFQNYVFVTRVMQERESSAGVKPLRLMERSVFSDRMVFVRAVHEAKWMNEMEINIYDSWFDPVVSVLPGLIPDGFIYLRATPDTCHKRMQLRRRAEEGGVSLDYLRDLHEKHESWLFPYESGNHGVLAVSRPPIQFDNSLHPEIRDRVFYLEGNHMHSSIQKVPALVLDCEANIDFNRDIEAKEHYARQVSEFFKYVKNRKEVSPPKPGGSLLGNRQVLMPPEGGLLFPNDKNLPEQLRSLQFRRAMSLMPGQ